jgi:hypothetical protein
MYSSYRILLTSGLRTGTVDKSGNLPTILHKAFSLVNWNALRFFAFERCFGFFLCRPALRTEF